MFTVLNRTNKNLMIMAFVTGNSEKIVELGTYTPEQFAESNKRILKESQDIDFIKVESFEDDSHMNEWLRAVDGIMFKGSNDLNWHSHNG